MTAGFHTFCNDGICTGAFHSSCESNRRNNRNDLNASFFPSCHIFARIASTCSDHRYFFVNDQLCQIFGIRAHQHDVHAKRFVADFFLANANLFSEVIDRGTAAGNDADTAGIGDSRSKGALCNPSHTALKNRIFASEQFCNSCFHLKDSFLSSDMD